MGHRRAVSARLRSAALLLVLVFFGPIFALQSAAADCPPCEQSVSGLQPHKLNYALALMRDSVEPPDERQEDEAKFQISLKTEIYCGFYVAYTQKSFWQIYDGPHSRPFRESNYNPELFYDWRIPFDDASITILRIGAEHESNGQTIDRTRSWNRAYVWPSFKAGSYSAGIKVWSRFPEDKKTSATDTQGDENPEIVDYMGNVEAYGAWRPLNSLELTAMVRKGKLDHSGTYELNVFTDFGLGWPTIRLMAQYFSGYGESLFDYNHRVDKVGVGFGFW